MANSISSLSNYFPMHVCQLTKCGTSWGNAGRQKGRYWEEFFLSKITKVINSRCQITKLALKMIRQRKKKHFHEKNYHFSPMISKPCFSHLLLLKRNLMSQNAVYQFTCWDIFSLCISNNHLLKPLLFVTFCNLYSLRFSVLQGDSNCDLNPVFYFNYVNQ